VHRVVKLALFATALPLVLWSRPVAAQPTQASQAYLDAFDKGVAAYRLGNFADARNQFNKAIAIQEDLPGPYRWLTVIAQAEQKWDECLQHAVKAVRLNPTSKHAPTVRALHSQCRKSLGRPEFRGVYGDGGAIAVMAGDIEGGLVKLNGLKYGALPMRPRAFAAGIVDVSVEVQGYLSRAKKAELLPGMVTDVIFTLEIDPAAPPPESGVVSSPTEDVKTGWVKLHVNPENSTVTFDGQPAKLDKEGRIEVAPGTYVAIVEAEDYEPWSRRVRVHLGQNKLVVVNLRRTEQRDSARRKGYYALGVAAVFGVAGAYFGTLENNAYEEAEDIWGIETVRPPLEDPATSPLPVRTRADIKDATDRGKRYRLISGAAFGLAATAMGASIYYFLKERPVEREGYPLPIAVTPLAPTGGDYAGVGAQVTYTATFDGLW